MKKAEMEKVPDTAPETLDVVPVEAGGSVMPVGGDSDWSLPSSDVLESSIPILKIAYQGSKDRPADVSPGCYFNSLTGQSFNEVKVLLLDISMRKSMWPRYDASVQKPSPICASDDGILPCGRGTDPKPGPCRSWIMEGRVRKLVPYCPFGRWTGSNGDRKPPECPDQFTCLLWLVEEGYPVLFTTKRKGEKALERVKTELDLSRHLILDRDYPDVPARFWAPIQMGLKNEGTYWTPTFKLLRDAGERTSTDLALQIHQMFAHLRRQVSSLTAEEVLGKPEETTEEPSFP